MTNKVHISQMDDRVIAFETGANLLGGGGIFTGEVVQVAGYGHITGWIYSDVASAASGVIIEQALTIDDLLVATPNTTNVTSSTLAYTAGEYVSNAYSVQVVAPFARIVYVNGAAAQSEFRLYFEARVFRGL